MRLINEWIKGLQLGVLYFLTAYLIGVLIYHLLSSRLHVMSL